MINIVKRKINMTDELRSKIKWACTFNNCVPIFNIHEYFYIGNLENKYPIARLQDMVNWYFKCI